MLKDYPATQLFLITLLLLAALFSVTPLVLAWNKSYIEILSSLKFIVKVLCALFLFFTVIDIADCLRARKQKHSH